MTYAELIASALRLGSGLSQLLPRGATLVVFSPNSLLFPTVLFGSIAAGIIVSGASPSFTASELQYQLEDSGASIIVSAWELRAVAQEAAKAAGWSDGRIYLLPGVEGERENAGAGFKDYSELIGQDGFSPVVIDDPATTVACEWVSSSRRVAKLKYLVQIYHTRPVLRESLRAFS